jgi:DNA repair protein RecN (Recombination protein N)
VLRQLSIRDVVLIDRLDLEFEPGLGVLTGETGAGKSILLDSLGLALGLRADSGLVRSGEAQAAVSAEFDLPAGHQAYAALDEQGIELEQGEPLILRRTLKADGGSRAFAGGASVNAALLRDLAQGLVEIHGQHDDRGLLNPKGHRALLDAFGRIDGTSVASAWSEVARLDGELRRPNVIANGWNSRRQKFPHWGRVRARKPTLPNSGRRCRRAKRRAKR